MTGQQIKAARIKLGLTQKELAQKLGVTENTVTRWECGDRQASLMVAVFLRKLVGELKEPALAAK